jgi:uncharacterized protein YuzE
MADVHRDYDEECDVLYVTVGEPTRNARSSEDEHGLIWRTSPDGKCLGVTIPDFRYFWSGREEELNRLLAERIPEPVFA